MHDRLGGATAPIVLAPVVVPTGRHAHHAQAQGPDCETGLIHPLKGVVEATRFRSGEPLKLPPGFCGSLGRRWWGGERIAARPAGARASDKQVKRTGAHLIDRE